MGERIPERGIYIRYSGLFDFDTLYAAIIDWFKNYGYIWYEETYKHKVPSPKGAELEWYWYGEKEITDYVKYVIHLFPHAWEITELEVTKDGKKKILYNGRIEIVLQGEFITDWQKKWGKSKFSQFLGRAYEKMMRRDLESIYIDNLYYRIWNLHAVIKKFFDMQTKWHEYKRYLGED